MPFWRGWVLGKMPGVGKISPLREIPAMARKIGAPKKAFPVGWWFSNRVVLWGAHDSGIHFPGAAGLRNPTKDHCVQCPQQHDGPAPLDYQLSVTDEQRRSPVLVLSGEISKDPRQDQPLRSLFSPLALPLAPGHGLQPTKAASIGVDRGYPPLRSPYRQPV